MKLLKIGDLQIPVPVIQGGMGIGISLSGLASAVANMGGVGVISTVGIGFLNNDRNRSRRENHIEAIRQEIRKARQLTEGVLGVNIMSVLTNFSDMVMTSIDEGIDIIFAGAGLPLDLPKYLQKGVKTKLVPIVSSARAASIIAWKWKQNYDYLPDAFVVEGPKAGGHLGFKADQLQSVGNSLEKIISDVMEVVQDIKAKFNREIPVIAAGGIYSGKDMFSIMKRGASAVQIGTRFVATEECDASPVFKDAFIKAKTSDIRIINSPVGMPGRAIHNKFLLDAGEGKKRPAGCGFNCIKSCNPKTTRYCIADALISAYNGKMDDGFAFTGTSAGKIKKISTVSKIFDDLKRGYLKAEKTLKIY
ncbi:MAG: nitronate monooxygenase [Bacteroidales bacterium]|nr:nitronate monooxygenase [Bacteroidales bacterium]